MPLDDELSPWWYRRTFPERFIDPGVASVPMNGVQNFLHGDADTPHCNHPDFWLSVCCLRSLGDLFNGERR